MFCVIAHELEHRDALDFRYLESKYLFICCFIICGIEWISIHILLIYIANINNISYDFWDLNTPLTIELNWTRLRQMCWQLPPQYFNRQAPKIQLFTHCDMKCASFSECLARSFNTCVRIKLSSCSPSVFYSLGSGEVDEPCRNLPDETTDASAAERLLSWKHPFFLSVCVWERVFACVWALGTRESG